MKGTGYAYNNARHIFYFITAGNALLTVAMISSNGRPAGELTYKKQRATVYQVTFKAEEKGEHMLYVRWGTDDIPGSPFPIEIV